MRDCCGITATTWRNLPVKRKKPYDPSSWVEGVCTTYLDIVRLRSCDILARSCVRRSDAPVTTFTPVLFQPYSSALPAISASTWTQSELLLCPEKSFKQLRIAGCQASVAAPRRFSRQSASINFGLGRSLPWRNWRRTAIGGVCVLAHRLEDSLSMLRVLGSFCKR